MHKEPNDSGRDDFQIFLRIRPSAVQQLEEETVKKLTDKVVEVRSLYYSDTHPKTYEFNEVFNQTVSNQELFNRTMPQPIQNVMNGYNSSVLIYGMTGAGKTHTMFGRNQQPDGDGMIFLTIRELYSSRTVDSTKTNIRISFYEIYNENIRDLLKSNSDNLTISEDPCKGIIINELTEVHCQTEIEARKIINQGIEKRAMNYTLSNEFSSRSHAIIQIRVSRLLPDDGQSRKATEAKLFMVDLAGNEKTYTNYTNLNKRFVQGVKINKSLLTLGKCISILASNKKSQVAPFRDSKLTRILKESLGGNSKTILIACVSPDVKYYEETINTLKYTCTAGNIRNKSKKNVRQAHESQLYCQREPNLIKSSNQSQVCDLVQNLTDKLTLKIKAQNIIQRLRTSLQMSNIGSSTMYEIEQTLNQVEIERRNAQTEANIICQNLIEMCRDPRHQNSQYSDLSLRQTANRDTLSKLKRQPLLSVQHSDQQKGYMSYTAELIKQSDVKNLMARFNKPLKENKSEKTLKIMLTGSLNRNSSKSLIRR